MQLSQKLRSLRKSLNLTLLQVSQQTGLSVSFLSDIERGRTNASLDTLNKLAICYSVNTSQLLEGTHLGEVRERNDLPNSLRDFIIQTPDIDESIIELMMSSESRSLVKYQSEQEWRELYYALKRIYNR